MGNSGRLTAIGTGKTKMEAVNAARNLLKMRARMQGRDKELVISKVVSRRISPGEWRAEASGYYQDDADFRS
jgi:hypothetical protein